MFSQIQPDQTQRSGNQEGNAPAPVAHRRFAKRSGQQKHQTGARDKGHKSEVIDPAGEIPAPSGWRIFGQESRCP
ncbi:hypothetical protein D3C80_1475260 [compost metagenome]